MPSLTGTGVGWGFGRWGEGDAVGRVGAADELSGLAALLLVSLLSDLPPLLELLELLGLSAAALLLEPSPLSAFALLSALSDLAGLPFPSCRSPWSARSDFSDDLSEDVTGLAGVGVCPVCGFTTSGVRAATRVRAWEGAVIAVGAAVGASVGSAVGACVGAVVGTCVGAVVGADVAVAATDCVARVCVGAAVSSPSACCD